MGNNVSKEQIAAARHADLYAFLIKHHNSSFKIEGNSIRPIDNHSISIKKGYNGFKDFATGETGNSIEFLTNHMDYTFVDAVRALSNGTATICSMNIQQNGIKDVPPQFPAPVDGRYKNLFAYLSSRGISAETIQMLINQKIMYQEKSKNNIIFINAERNFGEIRGTYTYGKSFHGVVPNSRHDGFWWFRTSKTAAKAYICEAAVDAISLYELHKMQENHEDAYYISIAGVSKQPAIDRLKQSELHIVLAVDNDTAGWQCRDRNSELEYILSVNKDWNEDLQNLKNNYVAVG